METIRRIYGAVQSATFFMKKKHFFYTFICCLLKLHWLWVNSQKKMWCSFFWGQNGPENFFEFSKKNQKNRKKCIFFEKMLMVSWPFSHFMVLLITVWKSKFIGPKKNTKKKGFQFLKLFFKNENWTFIFVHFWI